jgi:hypothetical protein
MRDDHPIDRLSAMVEGRTSGPVADAMRVLSQQLARRRHWILGPPELLNESGGPPGFVLSIHTARPPWGEEMDPAIDRAHLDEVKDLLGEIGRFSDEHHVSLVVEFAGEEIGTVEDGHLDEALTIGWIGEWERVLDERDL